MVGGEVPITRKRVEHWATAKELLQEDSTVSAMATPFISQGCQICAIRRVAVRIRGRYRIVLMVYSKRGTYRFMWGNERLLPTDTREVP